MELSTGESNNEWMTCAKSAWETTLSVSDENDRYRRGRSNDLDDND